MVYGAVVERGTIKEISGTNYVVESIDRKGITTPPIPKVPWDEDTYSVGDTVYFFVFCDGDGMILSKSE